MATSVGQYAPVFLPGEAPVPYREAWQATAYRVTKSQTQPKRPCARRHKTFLACAPVRVDMKVAQLLGSRGPWRCQACRDMDCLRLRSYGPNRVFFWTSCSWWSEGLFGQSFSVALPIQALSGLPCLGPFSCSERPAYRRTPRWWSYSVDQYLRHLKGRPGWSPTP